MKIITTADGSSSIYVKNLDEHYHSIHGAIQESKHIFIKSGLFSENLRQLDDISILEIGFGTGLNALLTYFSSIEMQKHVHYSAIEPHPLDNKYLQLLNYGNTVLYPQANEIFSLIHAAAWEKQVKISENFSLCKYKISALDIEFPQNFFNLVYFDAFSPASQPELWTDTLFEKIYNSMKINGVFVTYSAKGSVKRVLQQVGFCIEKLPGPAKKREILRGIKKFGIVSLV